MDEFRLQVAVEPFNAALASVARIANTSEGCLRRSHRRSAYGTGRCAGRGAGDAIMPGRKQATAGMATSGILTPGAPGMATIEAAGIL